MSNQIAEVGRVTEFLDRHVLSLGSSTVTVGMILIATIVAIASLAVAWLVKRLMIRHFERHEAGDEVPVKTAANLVAMVVLLVGFDIVLHIFGLRLTSLFAAGGIFALGAGFAVKNTVENYLSGVVLRLDRTIQRGDVVELPGSFMRIERIGLRSTVGRTADGVEVLVPNSTLAGATVRNLTRDDRLIRVTGRVGVALDSDRAKVRAALEIVADRDCAAVEQQQSEVVLEEITDRSIVYTVTIWIDDVARMKLAKSELLEAIWRELDAAGVALA